MTPKKEKHLKRKKKRKMPRRKLIAIFSKVLAPFSVDLLSKFYGCLFNSFINIKLLVYVYRILWHIFLCFQLQSERIEEWCKITSLQCTFHITKTYTVIPRFLTTKCLHCIFMLLFLCGMTVHTRKPVNQFYRLD